MLTVDEKREIQKQIEELGSRRAAVLEALKIVQRARGWVSDACLAEVAALLEMTPSELDGVATGFNMIHRRPVGRHVVLVCDSVSCWIMGHDFVLPELQRLLGVTLGQTTPDLRFTLLPVACLGLCDQAPALMVDEDTHVQLTPRKLAALLEQYP